MRLERPHLLAECIARLERTCVERGTGGPRVATGWPAIDAHLGGGIAPAGLHEWWGASEDVRAVLVQLAWRAVLQDDAERPGQCRHVAWVGRAAWPSPDHLVRGLRAPLAGMFGATRIPSWPDARLHDRSILVDVPAHDDGARLWAIEQAARCPGVCAVVADGRGFPMPATRRLQLASSGTLLLSMRGPERRAGERRTVPSACATRWWVTPASGIREVPWLRAMHALAARIAPEPAWTVRLERAKGVGIDPDACPEAVATEWWRTEGVPDAPARVRRVRAHRVARAASLRGARAS
jgi:hypothetical protein